MSRYYAPGQSEPWFRIGSFEVRTTELITALSVLSMIVVAIVPGLFGLLGFTPAGVLRYGFVWQIVTWPLANVPNLMTIWSIAVFWWMGRRLEQDLGRGPYGILLLGITAAQSICAFLLGLVIPSSSVALAGIGTIAMLIVGLFILENPKAPFFFGIPAWVLGAVMVGLPILMMVAARQWIGLLVFLLSIVVTAILGRTFGLLSQYSWIPSLAWTPRKERKRRRTARESNVYTGSWPGSGADAPAEEDSEMDDLLDKITANGLDSLTPRERRRLDELRRKRRGN